MLPGRLANWEICQIYLRDCLEEAVGTIDCATMGVGSNDEITDAISDGGTGVAAASSEVAVGVTVGGGVMGITSELSSSVPHATDTATNTVITIATPRITGSHGSAPVP